MMSTEATESKPQKKKKIIIQISHEVDFLKGPMTLIEFTRFIFPTKSILDSSELGCHIEKKQTI